MSGYRQHSFDPNAGGDYGRPLRPFNGWQWLGVAFIVIGAAVFLAVTASKLGWIGPGLKDSFPAATSLLLIGTLFVNSRRERLTPEDSAGKRRQALIALAVALIACAVGAALILYFKGA